MSDNIILIIVFFVIGIVMFAILPDVRLRFIRQFMNTKFGEKSITVRLQ